MNNLKAWELQKLLNAKKITCSELVDDSIQKIENDDTNSFVNLNFKNAKEKAGKIDEEQNKNFEKFEGVPVAIEDSFAVKDLNFTCSSKMLENFNAPYDSEVALKLKSKNTILMGKTNLNELGFGKDSENKSFKTSLNPKNKNLASGVRNSGAASSVASDIVTAAIGSDIVGEQRIAASFLGLVSIKPTYGTISRYGLNEVSNSFEQGAVIAKDVKDAFNLISLIKGFDEKDSTSIENKDYDLEFESIISELNLKNLKIACPKNISKYCKDENKLSLFNKAVEILKENGAQIEEVEMKTLDYVSYCNLILTFVEYSSNTLKFDCFRYGYRPDSYQNVFDMYKKGRKEAFGYDVKKKIMLGTYFVSVDQLEKYYKKALKLRRLINNEFSEIFAKFDVVMTPTVVEDSLLKDEQLSIEKEMNYSLFTSISNITGNAAITVPLCKEEKPFGIQFMADNFKDNNMIKAGYFLERLANEY